MRSYLRLRPMQLRKAKLTNNRGPNVSSAQPMSKTAITSILDSRKQFLGFVRRRVPNRAIAEDILQAAYLRALQHDGELRQEESVASWFYRVLRNAVIDYYRRRSTEDRALLSWGQELETMTDPNQEAHDEICGCLKGVLDRIRPAYSTLLREVDLGEQPLQEFARAHNLSTSNAGVRAHRARIALRKQLIKTCGSCAEHACINCTCRR